MVETGVKQGCILSPLLFGVAIDWVMRKCCRGETGIDWVENSQLEDLDFADDIALLSRNNQDMQRKTDNLSSIASKVGLQISYEKTNIMKTPMASNADITLESKMIKITEQFTYLGSNFDCTGNVKKEIMIRIGKATSAFKSLNKIWNCKLYSIKTKLRIFNSNVVSILTYASESWKMTKDIESKLNAFENRCLRKIMNIKWNEFRRSDEIRDMSGQPLVTTVIRKRRWRYVGHTLRRNDQRISKQALKWDAKGSRKRGRPKETLKRTLLREAGNIGLSSMEEIERVAQDRAVWRNYLQALCNV